MMSKILITTICFIVLSINLFSQESCSCNEDFNFVIEKIEKEHPGFSVNVTVSNRDAYNQLKDSIYAETLRAGITKEICLKNIKKYLSFIRDKHLQIYDPVAIGENDYEKTFVARNLPQSKNLNDSTHYIRIPSFNYKLWKELDSFYDGIEPIIKDKKMLIVDLRNNSGGGERMYGQLLKILRSNSERIKIGVVFNRKCASACEEVALKITAEKNIETFGENTSGQFAYGAIKGYKTPNCGFTLVTTTEKYPDRLKYEYVGVQPKILLDKEKESEWIDIIEKKLAS